jgi:hypothetical protein
MKAIFNWLMDPGNNPIMFAATIAIVLALFIAAEFLN